MKIAVKDANIFIDVELMGLFDLWLQLPYETLTTSLVVTELLTGGHEQALGYIRTEMIREEALDSFELSEQLEKYADTGLSDTDVSVIYLAQREKALLLSGDMIVRNTAQVEEVEVHGTIWIMDQLVEAGILCRLIAAEKLEFLIGLTGDKQRYLPHQICIQRIQIWRKESSN